MLYHASSCELCSSVWSFCGCKGLSIMQHLHWASSSESLLSVWLSGPEFLVPTDRCSALGGSISLRIPAFPNGGCLIDYVPSVLELLRNKVSRNAAEIHHQVMIQTSWMISICLCVSGWSDCQWLWEEERIHQRLPQSLWRVCFIALTLTMVGLLFIQICNGNECCCIWHVHCTSWKWWQQWLLLGTSLFMPSVVSTFSLVTCIMSPVAKFLRLSISQIRELTPVSCIS